MVKKLRMEYVIFRYVHVEQEEAPDFYSKQSKWAGSIKRQEVFNKFLKHIVLA